MVSEIRMTGRPVARLAVPLALVLATSVVVSLLEGAPEKLPGVALGSEVLMHVERVSAMFAMVVAILSVLYEASRGRLPTQLTTGSLAYEAERPAARAAEHLQTQFDDLRARLQRLETMILDDDGHES